MCRVVSPRAIQPPLHWRKLKLFGACFRSILQDAEFALVRREYGIRGRALGLRRLGRRIRQPASRRRKKQGKNQHKKLANESAAPHGFILSDAHSSATPGNRPNGGNDRMRSTTLDPSSPPATR